MSFYSDIMMISGKRAYNMLKKAWKKDGFVPVKDAKCADANFMVVEFHGINNFGLGTELYHVLKGLQYMESEKETYAVKAIAINENNTCDTYSNEIGASVFEEFDVSIRFNLPDDFRTEDVVEQKESTDKKLTDEEKMINIRGVLETTAKLLDGNLNTETDETILSDVMSSLSILEEPGVLNYVLETLFPAIVDWANSFVVDGPITDYEVIIDDIRRIWYNE